MPTHNIEGYHVVTEQRWTATCGDQQATGMTEEEAINALMGLDRKVRMRSMINGRVDEEEWVTRAQLERYWDDIAREAKRVKATIILDHPESQIIHIFSY